MIKAINSDGTVNELNYTVNKEKEYIEVTISKETASENIKYINFEYFDNIANEGDSGYMIVPNGGMLCSFCNHDDGEYITDRYEMPIFGAKTEDKTFLAIVTGMAFNYSVVCGRKDGKYYIYPRFDINGDRLYEDIVVKYYMLTGEDANYSGMARKYREYQLTVGGCKTLLEKAKENALIEYAKDSVYVRIRLAWKPCPSPVMHQTKENEPEVIVACDFERVEKLLDKFKERGIEKAEICLVGWNAKGHDGRWPQCFPVCEELGGEEKLRSLITKAQKMGYQIVCHTNSTDTYEISELWNKDDLLLTKNGEPPEDESWSAGHMYHLCPEIAWKQAKEILPEVAKLGFKGIHYIDVLNIVKPRKCYNEKHPLNVGQTIGINRNIMKFARELFGGYSSEGGYDFGAKYQDYALNLCYYGEKCPNPFCDEIIPLWQLVYHGIIMSNPSLATTVNYPITGDINKKLKVIEFGGRPTFYYYWKFRNDWEKEQDNLILTTEEDMDRSVDYILDGAKLFEELSYLQTQFMNSHEKISNGVYKTTYSNGTEIIVDYNKGEYRVEN